MIKILRISLLVFLLVSLIATMTMAKDDTLDNILKSGVVKIGFCVDVPPIKFRDKNQEPTGMCADFAKALARDLGVKLEYVFSDWAGLIPNLLSERCDVIIGDMARTLERAKKVNFTNPWYISGSYIVVKTDSKWTNWKEMNIEGIKIGCIVGGLGEQHIKEKIPKATPTAYNSNVEQHLALEQGRIDGLFTTNLLALREIERSEGKFRLLPDPVIGTTEGFTLRSDDYHFLIWMNLWLDNMKLTGEYDKLMDYWYNTSAWQKDYPEISN